MAKKKKHERLNGRTVLIVLLTELGLLLLCGLAAFLLIRSERTKHLSAKHTYMTAPPETPAPTAIPNLRAPETEPDTSALDIPESVLDAHPGEFSRLYWVDITPEGMEGYTLLRHISLGLSYLICPDGSSKRLGEQSEGCGVVSALYIDLDADDKKELLYTYTVTGEDGTGCAVGWLHLSTGAEVTAPFTLSRGNLAFSLEDGRAVLYKAELTQTDSAGSYALLLGESVGEVAEREGSLALIVY